MDLQADRTRGQLEITGPIHYSTDCLTMPMSALDNDWARNADRNGRVKTPIEFTRLHGKRKLEGETQRPRNYSRDGRGGGRYGRRCWTEASEKKRYGRADRWALAEAATLRDAKTARVR